jgi:hypothetical protein
MCVLICANSNVREWLDIPLARAYRESLQLCPTSPSSESREENAGRGKSPSRTKAEFELDESTRRRVMKRSAWLQAYCRYRAIHVAEHHMHLVDSGGSTREWQKAFETIAKTWGRILSLVGLR